MTRFGSSNGRSRGPSRRRAYSMPSVATVIDRKSGESQSTPAEEIRDLLRSERDSCAPAFERIAEFLTQAAKAAVAAERVPAS
jgi:hypothetical protein